MTRLRLNPNYGDAHSRLYKPSILEPFLVVKNEKKEIVSFHNDVKLLLRQKDLQKSIGYEAIRAYVDKLNTDPVPKHNLTDDELISLIPPDGIDTITDLYQYNKYLDEHRSSIKKKYNDYQEQYRKVQDFKKRYCVDNDSTNNDSTNK